MATELNGALSPFVGRHIGPSTAEQGRMLAALNVADLEALVAQVVPAGAAVTVRMMNSVDPIKSALFTTSS